MARRPQETPIKEGDGVIGYGLCEKGTKENSMNGYPSHTHQTHYPTYYATRAAVGPVDPARVLAAGGLGFVVGGSAALGVNLHKVRANCMTLNEALVDTIAKGAGAGVATAAATAAASAVGGSGIVSLAVMIASATGVIYLLSSVGKHVTDDVVVPSKKAR